MLEKMELSVAAGRLTAMCSLVISRVALKREEINSPKLGVTLLEIGDDTCIDAIGDSEISM